MARKQAFLAAKWSDRFQVSYAKLSPELQRACDKALLAVIKQELSSGLRVKPIQPDKYFLEARVDSGHRVVFRIEGATLFFVDVIDHDKIPRYGRRPAKNR